MEPADTAQYALLAVLGIITIVAVAAFSRKLGVAAPLLLVLIGIGYSYLPGGSTVQVPPEIILVAVLPPLLYAAAINVPLVDFRRNLSTISALSVVLVLVTAFVTGILIFFIFPDLNLGFSIALGAVISPTDAVAATSLGKRLGLPPRLVTILEGESLVNDATALVMLRSAVAVGAAATAAGSTVAAPVNIGGVLGDFGYAVALAIVVGLVIGAITVFVRSKLRDPVLDSAISFAVPFIAFIPAEELHASGVLAVVVAGLYAGHNSAKHFTPQARISERLNWRTAQFVLENGVFLIMGIQISGIIESVLRSQRFSLEGTLLAGLFLTVVIVFLRFLFVGPLLYLLQRRRERAEVGGRFGAMLERIRAMADPGERAIRRRERAERYYDRRAIDLKRAKAEGFGWRGGVILSWAGMRGVVTLAAAQSLPAETPYRPQLILIAFTVAVVTLIVQGGTLPWLIKLSGIRGADRVADRRELATLLDEMSEAGVSTLDHPDLRLPRGERFNPEVIERVRHDTLLGAESAWERADHGSGDDVLADSPHQQYRALRREVLRAERDALLEARSRGNYASRILSRAQAMLDLEETRLEQLDNPSGS